MEIVVATNNSGKLKEIKKILGKNFILTSLADNAIDIEIKETGKTFYENALIKAKAVSKLTKKPAIADDSGLVVFSLNGEPGIYSARYGGKEGDDTLNKKHLLDRMKQVIDRKAEFYACIVLFIPKGYPLLRKGSIQYLPKDKIIMADGRVFGEILRIEKGTNGFGYDSVFYSPELEKSFAEANEEEKNKVSHRARALQNLLERLKEEKIIITPST